MMLATPPMISQDLGLSFKAGRSEAAAEPGFSTFMDRAMEKKVADEPMLSLVSVLEGMRNQWQAFVSMGRQEVSADSEALNVLRKMILGSGLDEDSQDAMMMLLDDASGQDVSLGRLLERLHSLAEGMESFENSGDAGLALGLFPFVYTLLRDMGIPEDRIATLMDRSITEGKGFSLEGLGREWAMLRDDLTRGSLVVDAGGREEAIRVLDSLLQGLGSMSKSEMAGFSHDTAAMLERLVLSAMADQDLGRMATSRTLEFSVPAMEVAAGFLREVQPGRDPAGVTELRTTPFEKIPAAVRPVGDPGLQAWQGLEGSETDQDSRQSLDDLLGRWLELTGDRDTGDEDEDGWAALLRSRSVEKDGDRSSLGSGMGMGHGRGSEGSSVRTQAPPPPPPAYVMDQVGKKMAHAIREGQNEVSFQLKPEHLGRLHLHIETIAGGVHIRILAEKKGAHDMLLTQVAELKSQMQEQGLRVERMEVSVAPDFDTALFRERGRERQSRQARQAEERREKGAVSSVEGSAASSRTGRVWGRSDSRLDLMV
ncbi:flagellar hook-length control protein FliK [Desulfobotulus sp. H1]|uniref:Flagellar hook-length control protein FliK n=1 Tax=Desulfobotulus pelophilus TaxID=2823377 RepID=A0ABT3N8M9_9BACT|nr:flagellar hook-length control protein FliK [Desulfobotulus pelophilus]MCW7753813.1 flagellar hook-length control protein FliK [Desulfobotulus pelophilus]